MGELLFGLRGGHRPGKFIQRADMIAEMLFDQSHHIFGNVVRRKLQARWRHMTLWQFLAIVSVIIPLPTKRLIAIHQQSGFAPHFAIEEFHPQLCFTGCPIFKFFMCRQKSIIRQNLHRHAQLLRPASHFLVQAIFAGRGNQQTGEAMFFNHH